MKLLDRLLRGTGLLLLALMACTAAAPAAWSQTLYVDDDAPNDPGPNDPNFSDPLEDGTQAHPFDSIQEAIDYASIPCDVHVMPGQFVEAVSLPYTGCSITGSGRTSTFLSGTGGTILSAVLYSDPNQPGVSSIKSLSMAEGLIYFETDGAVHLEDASLSSAPISIWIRYSSAHVTLSSLTMTDSSLTLMDSEGIDPLVALDNITMSGGSIATHSYGSYGSITARHLSAPSTRILLDRSSGGHKYYEIQDSTIGGLWDTLDGSSGGSDVIVDNVHFTSTGVTADNGEGGHSMSISNSVFDHGGVEVTNIPDWDGNPRTSISISRCEFRESGVSMRSDLHTFEEPGGPYPLYPAIISLAVMHSTFHGDGIVCDTRASLGDVGTVDLFVANSLFQNVTEGVRINVEFPDADPLLPTSSTVQSKVVNNTFVTTGAGVRISTNPHVGPSGHSITTLKNNVLAGGSVGVEVSGAVGNVIQFEANDVWSATGANWMGDVSDQTGQHGNISADPLFVNLAAGDYRITTNSPCIDAGVGGVEVPNDDFEGTPRPLDGDLDGRRTVDIGAFEFAPDGDDDGRNVGLDCDDHNPFAWETPGEVRNVDFRDAESFDWEAPVPAGGVFAFYDTLRTAGTADFVGAAVCIESNDALDSRANDADSPPPDGVFFYLVRAENLCVPGQGPLGFRSNGASTAGRACP